MLFNSYAFIFAYFPIVLFGFFLIGWRSTRAAAGFLGLASLFFYGYWSLAALPLLLASICWNYWFGLQLTPHDGLGSVARKRLLIASLVLNLGVLAVFKYADFFIGSVNFGLASANIEPLPMLHLLLPIGISFYTFTQIAFLVDCYQGKVRERSFVHYVLFVTYFPHLIAGPVLHHAQMMPQFADASNYRMNGDKIAQGLAIFTFGLAKKLLIADPMGSFADVVFNGAENGIAPSLYSAWFGVLAYTLQIYFDFSGYSDMAIGISLCFGIHLPLNFNAPYKSVSIIEFWRRWHISLSTFLRDYLYISLGGNRKGPARRYINLFLTMLLGGLWHGAAWTFVLWGALHGAFLMVNHFWNALVGKHRFNGPVAKLLGWLLTFVCVMVAWVVFRAHSMDSAMAIYKGMLGLNGAPLTAFREYGLLPLRKNDFYQLMLLGLFICVALPTTITLVRWVPSAQILQGRAILSRLFTVALAAVTAYLFGLSVSKLGNFSPFLYFQF